jgi:hypothetical protein
MAGIPKVALDFLLRPATMTSRQHGYQGFLKDGGKLARRRQYHCCVGGYRYAVWFMRGLQQLLCVHAEVATDVG